MAKIFAFLKEEIMKDNSLARLGGICSMLVGVSYIVVGITYVLLPPAQKAVAGTDRFLYSVALDATMISIQYWAFALGAILALAAVPAISEQVRSASEGWVRWANNLALVGFAVTAVNYLRLVTVTPDRAAVFAVGDEMTRKAISWSQFGLDPNGWLGFGCVGVWVLVVSILALRANALPKFLNYLGILVGIAYWLVVVGFVSNLEMLVTVSAGLGGIILGPIWYIWIGFKLRQAS
jgi:hypothetical protein